MSCTRPTKIDYYRILNAIGMSSKVRIYPTPSLAEEQFSKLTATSETGNEVNQVRTGKKEWNTL